MRKLLIILAFSTSLHATIWYATSAGANIDTAGLWKPTQTGSCTASGTALVWGAQANGDIFNANGCNGIVIDVDPGSVSVQVTLESDASNGGNFNYATASNLNIHANLTDGKNQVLAITGSTGGGSITGTFTTVGATGSGNLVADSHTTVTFTVNGDTTIGSLVNGWTVSGGPLVINGNLTAGGSNTYGVSSSGASAAVTVNGNCIGSDTTNASGCLLNGTTGATLTVTGNLIFGKSGPAIGYGGSSAGGLLFYVPASNSNYILLPKDSSYVLGTVNSHATQMFPAGAGGSGPYGYVR